MEENKKITGIKALLIIEIIGKPPKHLTKTLGDIINLIDKEEGVIVTDKKIKTPVPLKKKKGFYTSFAEIEVEVEQIIHIAILMFKYMPANLEILSPELIALTSQGWSEIFNELARRLHGYDEVARVLQIERKILENKLKGVLEKSKSES